MKFDCEFFFINGMFINYIVVILVCYEDVFCFMVDDWMICIFVFEWQFECIFFECECDQLMVEIDVESWIMVDDVFDFF